MTIAVTWPFVYNNHETSNSTKLKKKRKKRKKLFDFKLSEKQWPIAKLRTHNKFDSLKVVRVSCI